MICLVEPSPSTPPLCPFLRALDRTSLPACQVFYIPWQIHPGVELAESWTSLDKPGQEKLRTREGGIPSGQWAVGERETGPLLLPASLARLGGLKRRPRYLSPCSRWNPISPDSGVIASDRWAAID